MTTSPMRFDREMLKEVGTLLFVLLVFAIAMWYLVPQYENDTETCALKPKVCEHNNE